MGFFITVSSVFLGIIGVASFILSKGPSSKNFFHGENKRLASSFNVLSLVGNNNLL